MPNTTIERLKKNKDKKRTTRTEENRIEQKRANDVLFPFYLKGLPSGKLFLQPTESNHQHQSLSWKNVRRFIKSKKMQLKKFFLNYRMKTRMKNE